MCIRDSSTGVISGDIAFNTSANSPYTFTVQVTDGQQTVKADLSITVYAQLQITTTTLPDATEGASYTATIEAAGGTTPYTWTVSGLPSGLSWSQVGDTVEISGTPPSGSAGTYGFSVEVTDGQQTVSRRFDLVVNKPTPPKADFEASSTEGAAALTVTFTDKSAGTVTQWQWDFDNDGTPDSTTQNPTHTYSAPGWYTVKLTVTGPGGSDSCVKERYILVANDIYYVDGTNGDDGNGGTGWNDAWKTIGKALSVAGDYDLVLVADATYTETDLNFNGKKIYLKGVDKNTAGQRPVIDCQGNGRAFVFSSGETADSVVDNFTIRNGNASDYGGAVSCLLSSPSIINCTFSGNSAGSNAGAIYFYSGSPTLSNCTFSDNKAGGNGGGAIYCDSSNPTLTNCIFSGNSADGKWTIGGDGGAVYSYFSDMVLSNCTFSGNKAAGKEGGAICCYGGNLSLTHCTLINNKANWHGGAIYCMDNGNMSISNCLFSGNSALWGGAIHCINHVQLTLTNCTFSANSANCGGAIDCESSSSVTINNCILWDDSANNAGSEILLFDAGSSATLNHCCVNSGGYDGSGAVDDSNNCIYDDPQFVDAANGDYHLKDTSPCIDAGDNTLLPSGVTTDLEGNQRIVDGDNDGTPVVDIGAYEKQ